MTQLNRSRYAGLMLAALCAGCGGAGGGGGGGGNEVSTPAAAVKEAAPGPTAPAAAPVSPQAIPGGAAFSVDGSARQYDALPDGHNYYTPLASQITARPTVDAAEQLTITFASIDLRKLEYPADLPGPKQAGTLLDPLAAMAGVGFSYRTEDGREWAGPGRVRIDRYGRDGMIEVRFTDVSLPHTEKHLPDVTLTSGTLRARIGAPW